jgi:CubicO group peptidase (beta-lactamase class C family)
MVTPSQAAQAELFAAYGASLKGWIFYARKNKRPLAVAGHGKARRAAVDGLPPLNYDENTLVHVASVSKLICAAAVLRLIEDWNEIFKQTAVQPSGLRKYVGPPRPEDSFLISRVEEVGRALSIDDRFYDLIEPFLVWRTSILPDILNPNHSSVTIEVRFTSPGVGVRDVTILELLTHRSGLTGQRRDEGLARMNAQYGFENTDIFIEETSDNVCFFDMVKSCAVVCAADVGPKDEIYSSYGFDLLTGFVQFNTGRNFEEWAKEKLLSHSRFDDIAKRPVDPARAAYYYNSSDSSSAPGVFHPDYRNFSSTGGYYTSARAICDWVEAVMTNEVFGDRPILKDSAPILAAFLGCDPWGSGPLSGLAKNGGTVVRGGHTIARVGWLRGYGQEHVAVFVHSNEQGSADPLLDTGLRSIRRWAYLPAIMPPRGSLTAMAIGAGQLQATTWKPAPGGVAVQSLAIVPEDQTVSLGQRNLHCSNLLQSARPAVVTNEIQTIRMICYLRLPQGSYIFELASDDGALLFVDDRLAIDNDGHHPLVSVMSDSIEFDGREKKVEIIWFNSGGPGELYLAQSNTQTPQAPAPLPANWIFAAAKPRPFGPRLPRLPTNRPR